MSKSPLSTLELHRASECQVRLINDGSELGCGEDFPRGNYGRLTGYRWALIVGSGSAGRQTVFNGEDEYPPVGIC